jgi:Contractile injection system tube protein
MLLSRNSRIPNSQLQKAKLIPIGPGKSISFMFNPSELVFEGMVETADNPGARSAESGKPKVSFSNIKAYKVTIKNILFDTYEEGQDVVKQYINAFRSGVEFVGGEERPPIFRFIWGNQRYLRACFIEQLNYRLTMFLPDGTPVRAVIESLTLKEVDESVATQSLKAKLDQNISQSQRQQESIENKLKKSR